MKIGSVTQLGPARFWVRGPRPERLSLGVYQTRKEAEDVRAAAVQQLARADRTRMPGVTLRAFGTRVMAERERALPRSAPAEGTRWRRILMARFAEEPLAMLTPPAVDRWARRLVEEIPGSARYALTLLSTICGQAVREGIIATNPCAEVRVRRPARTHEPWTYLVPDEQRALVLAPIPETDALQIGSLLGTGVRDGELFALRLADVHAWAHEPHVVVRYGSPHAPPKGRKIRRCRRHGGGRRRAQELALAHGGRSGGRRRRADLRPRGCVARGARGTVYERRLMNPQERGPHLTAIQEELNRRAKVRRRQEVVENLVFAVLLVGLTLLLGWAVVR